MPVLALKKKKKLDEDAATELSLNPSIEMLARFRSTFLPVTVMWPFNPTVFVLERKDMFVAEINNLGDAVSWKNVLKKNPKNVLVLNVEPTVMVPAFLKLFAMRRAPAPLGPVSNWKP